MSVVMIVLAWVVVVLTAADLVYAMWLYRALKLRELIFEPEEYASHKAWVVSVVPSLVLFISALIVPLWLMQAWLVWIVLGLLAVWLVYQTTARTALRDVDQPRGSKARL